MDPGEIGELDSVNALLSGLINAVKRLFSPNLNALALAAFIHNNLLPHVGNLVDSNRWRLLSEPPHEAVLSIQQSLSDLHAVVAEVHYGEEARAALERVARRSKPQNSLPRCASVSRGRAERRLDEKVSRLTNRLRKEGVTVRVFRRQPAKPSGSLWPLDEVIVLVELASVLEWSESQKHLVTACSEVLEPDRTIFSAPLRDNHVIISLAGRVQSQFYPLPESLAGWTPDDPLALLTEKTSNKFWEAVESLGEMSAVLGGAFDGHLHHIELAVVCDAADKFNQLSGHLQALSSRDESGFVDEGIEFLSGLADQVLVDCQS